MDNKRDREEPKLCTSLSKKGVELNRSQPVQILQLKKREVSEEVDRDLQILIVTKVDMRM